MRWRDDWSVRLPRTSRGSKKRRAVLVKDFVHQATHSKGPGVRPEV